MARKRPDPADRPDVEIGASVHADSLRFREKPQTEVEVHGEVAEPDRRDDAIETTSGSERENLPDEVEPGVTYRDVSVRWRAAGRIPEEGRNTKKRRKR
jgi:hypothetical protein